MKVASVGMLIVLAVVGFSATEAWRKPHAGVAGSETGATATIAAPTIDATIPVAQEAASSTAPATAPAVPKPRLAVAFQLDPAVTGGIFLGTRWVSPPSWFFAQQGKQYVVRAKAQNIDRQGERTDLDGNWSVSDPQMVAISRGQDGVVTITVRQPGDSDMTVSAGQDSKHLHVHAMQVADAMQVRITQ